MTFAERKALTVTLTRQQVEDILMGQMGWEWEDVTVFWLLAEPQRNTGGRS